MLRTQRCIHSRLQAFASCPPLSLLTAAGQQRRGLSVESNEGLPSTFVEGYHDPDIVRKMRYRPLGSRCVDKNGVPMEVSIVSIGASAFGGMYGTETVEDECVEILRESVKSGINLIDAAAWYGHGRAEEVLGKALQGIPREAYYLNTKVCRYNPSIMEMFDWSYDRTMRAIDEALERMGVDYLDSIQVHDPEFAPSIDLVVSSVFPAFEEAKRQGKVRQLGVTGYPLETLRAQIDGADEAGIEINTCLSYCHYTLHDTTLVSELVPYLQEKGVGLIGASPISMGLLSNRGPPAWHPAPTLLKQLAAQAAEYCVKNDVDIGRLCMQFAIREESIPTTLFSTRSMKRFRENLQHCYDLNKMTEKEEEVLQYLLNDVFGPHGALNWQGIEVKQYWEMLDKARKGEATGSISGAM